MGNPAELAFVALGSNLGDRAAHLALARSELAALPGTRLIAATSVEETDPVGPVTQDRFLNQMVLLETALPPQDLLLECQRIELRAGREQGERWGPRTLDLDIIRYGDRILDERQLTIPHPELANRPFWRREIEELETHAG